MDRRPLTRLAAPLAIALSSAAACGDDAPATPGAGGATSVSSSVQASVSSAVSVGSGGAVAWPESFEVTGVVVDEEGTPVEGAYVLQGGTSHLTPALTASDGTFSIIARYGGFEPPAIVATKQGYRTFGIDLLDVPDGPITLTIDSTSPPDNTGYRYGDPGDGDDPSTAFCGHCHIRLTQQFQTSRHARATENPRLQDLYAGVTRAHADQSACEAAGGEWRQGLTPGAPSTALDKCYLGGGVLPDLNPSCGGAGEVRCDDPTIASGAAPTAFGACADCHAPAIDGVAGGRNLHEAEGIAFDNGVHCDLCHKVADIDLDAPAGVAGRLMLQRPHEVVDGSPIGALVPVYFGPLLDVPNSNMRGSLQPKFSEAVFCAGCHELEQPALVPGDSLDAGRWPDGLPVHTTYSEWEAGPYNAPETPCRFCHMPAVHDIVSSSDLATPATQSVTFGFVRPPEQIRSHIFRSPLEGSPRLIDEAAYVSIDVAVAGQLVTATVNVSNVGCGHALPTGDPMRSVVLLVTATPVGCAEPVPAVGGMTIGDAGGAHLRGVEGTDVTTAGTSLTWAAGAAVAQPGMVVRVVRPSGAYLDYPATGFFGDSLSAMEKGVEIATPVGEAAVVSAAAGTITLDSAIPIASGDVLWLGDPDAATDGASSAAYAGAPGHVFSKVLVDAAGTRLVPHHRAVDIASDTRIPPGQAASTDHVFDVPAACTGATIEARLVYRPHPFALGTARGWAPVDHLIAGASASASTP